MPLIILRKWIWSNNSLMTYAIWPSNYELLNKCSGLLFKLRLYFFYLFIWFRRYLKLLFLLRNILKLIFLRNIWIIKKLVILHTFHIVMYLVEFFWRILVMCRNDTFLIGIELFNKIRIAILSFNNYIFLRIKLFIKRLISRMSKIFFIYCSYWIYLHK